MILHKIYMMNSLKNLFTHSGQQCLLSNVATANTTTVSGSSLINFIQHRLRRVFPLIRGFPRPLPPNVPRPEPNKYNWLPILPPDNKYTILPLKIKKLSGRHPETGRVMVKTLGGGNKKYFRWIDYKRTANPDGTPFVEKVYNVRYDPLRSTKLALVAGG